MTLAEVKSYLRVDYDEDDAMISLMMSAAEEFIKGACGRFDETKTKAKMVYLAAIQELYDKRSLAASSTQGYSVTPNLALMMRSMLSQLQIEQFMEPDDDDPDDPDDSGSIHIEETGGDV